MKKSFALPSVLPLCLALCGCDKDKPGEDRGAAPPPIASTKPGACASGGGVPGDQVSASFFPRVADDYCVDPNGDTRAYGKNAEGTLDKVCTELFDGECEVYKSYGLERVVTLRYVDGKGSPGTVNVNLSRFATKEGAYGFFTQRVVADADPLEAAPQKLEAGAAGALGTGIAYVWRGQYVGELSYNNELESPDQLKQSSLRVLPPIAKGVGDKLPGDRDLPPSAAILPEQHRIPLAIRFEAKDALDVAGVGSGAMGFYMEGDKRWRVLGIARADEDAAKDVWKTLSKIDGAKPIKKLAFDALAVSRSSSEEAPKIKWVFGRQGARILGIGDEEFAMGEEGASGKAQLDHAAKLERLMALLTAETSPTQK